MRAFVTRLHFYVGLFVAPFIFVAALTGTLYVLTPQIESLVYRDQLVAQTQGPAQPLEAQISAARAAIGGGPKFFAVRPAPTEGLTTQVMFTQAGLGDSESRAIFVDPASLRVQGDLIVYGTSGILPLRTTIDYLHRNLLLGDFGRHYSELAASWLWVAVLGGLCLWFWRRRLPKTAGKGSSARGIHSLTGLWISLGLLFLSATGLTWSRWAGDHIDSFRTQVGWITPSVSLALGDGMAQPEGEHAEHQGHAGMAMPMPMPAPLASETELAAQADQVLRVARTGGIDSAMIEIRPPRSAGQAWMVREYDRQWPTQVDTIAVDPQSMTIVSRADFASFPFVSKLIRWGIDAHMGILFGLVNQVVMALLGCALMVMIGYGYRIWWLRRPAPGAMPQTLTRAWSYLSLRAKVVTVILALAFGYALPVLGASLLAFLLVDILRWRMADRKEDRTKRIATPAE
ncbi:PepSY domain-containing protein [Rhizobium deserti]|uniref:PepSY domain-containing protein n=1 Tax=Rhizobium deserti TaxID=2547961 RepID=A0A4R5UPN2_9HYPH|nr:PepSY domain-containing protein [Rhizobium deserti]